MERKARLITSAQIVTRWFRDSYDVQMKRAVCLLALTLTSTAAWAQWPQFRGPNGSGVSDAASLPVEIGPEKNVRWKLDLPPGHSSPVIVGNRIFLTAADPSKHAPAPAAGKVVDVGGDLYTICIDRSSGKVLWKRAAPRPRSETYQPTNSPASPSPVTDGRNVYVFFGDYGLLAYDLNGKSRWTLPLGPFNNSNGHGSSPILVNDLLILLCDQDTGSFLLAVDKTTGRVRWKTDRPESTRSYSTPALFKPSKGPAELIVPGAYQLASYSVQTGEKLWWITGLSWQPKSTPIVDGEMVYAHWWENGGEADQPAETPTFEDTLGKFDANGDKKIARDEFAADPRLQKGFGDLDLATDGYVDERDWFYYRARRASRNALLAVRPGGARGDLTGSPNIAWRMQKFLPNVPSPLLYRGALYLIKDGGILTSVDAKNGRILKQDRLAGGLDTYYASPVAGGGHVYFISRNGNLTVVKAERDTWDIVGRADFGDEAFATPAIADNEIYLRTRSALYCFGQ
ncbi:MAG TPA: PQQ-binding-like beta-propeller repeat protein [Bryobacteraceae bacterium]|nr:PQQ-binding-like beta-propeller repeat protein [Bryobacteraceae bacterium]